MMGIGFGDFGILHVGGVFKRVEYVVLGEALISALKSLRLAQTNKGVIVCKKTWELVEKYF